jgi:hypothetical protein
MLMQSIAGIFLTMGARPQCASFGFLSSLTAARREILAERTEEARRHPPTGTDDEFRF